MEDAHLLELDFEPGMHLFGVFDGHGGKEVAMYAARELIQTFKDSFPSKANPFKGSTVDEDLLDPDSVEQALINSFIGIDKKLSTKQVKKELMEIRNNNPEGKNPFLELLGLSDEIDRGKTEGINIFDSIGCTANVLFIHEGKYYCANAGDSR
eukprot:CAMPEP_0196994388 /NCGR_PEP_ID=MMETSP1380-20130617/691_1 /TAXON_ID=5936 /ORGANISM="Euplotes crassus, Strain CT5" /LENGTH=152 /DNA_ID=CAMNT_0042409745 /DNA_START=114 /DNA_END=572 /DNA_ORIENTATION=+